MARYCETRTREVKDGKMGPWMVCTRRAAKVAVSRNGYKYLMCAYHAAEIKDDPRLRLPVKAGRRIKT